MAGVTTSYSFADIKFVLQPPGYPAYTLNAQGVGEINFSYQNDNTAHEVAADGSVMVTKRLADNGTITISVQQSAPLHTYLKALFAFLITQPTALWAASILTVSSPSGLFDIVNATGVSITKRADQPYQAQGSTVTWSFMAANVQML